MREYSTCFMAALQALSEAHKYSTQTNIDTNTLYSRKETRSSGSIGSGEPGREFVLCIYIDVFADLYFYF